MNHVKTRPARFAQYATHPVIYGCRCVKGTNREIEATTKGCSTRYSHLKRFTLMYTDEGAGETNPTDWRENIIPYWIEYFFKDPRHLKIEGGPVVSIHHCGHFQRMFKGEDGARQAIQTLREAVAAAGFPGVLVLMEERAAVQRSGSASEPCLVPATPG